VLPAHQRRDPHTEHGDYVGTEVYPRTKRGKVIITEMRAEQLADRGVVCHSTHPGWAATPRRCRRSRRLDDSFAVARDGAATAYRATSHFLWTRRGRAFEAWIGSSRASPSRKQRRTSTTVWSDRI
jgi:hypothetical protein